MKKIITLVLLTACSLFSYAENNDGIKFENGSWAEITAKAKKDKKIIFIDCYTSWCGPCKRLSSEIFTMNDVGSFFNSHFVNCKMDMEKGEGIILKNKFHVGAYPTLLWVDHKGNIIHRALGFMKAEKLLSQAQTALKGGNLNTDLEEKYNKNKDNPEIVKNYFDLLNSTSDSRARGVAQQYLSIIPKEQYLNSEIFDMIASNIRDPFSSIITYIIDNRAEFNKIFSEGKVTNVINASYKKFADSLASSVKNGRDFDENSFRKLIELMKEREYGSREQVIEETRIKVLENKKEWKGYVKKLDSLLKAGFFKNPNSYMYKKWCNTLINSDCKDKDVLSYALLWLNMSFEKDEGFNMESYISDWEAKIRILEEMGDKASELEKAKIELALIKQFQIKQDIFSREQMRMMQEIQPYMK